jgi:hypothetical protein
LLGGVAGTVGAKVRLLFGMTKHFEGKCGKEAHFYVFLQFFLKLVL